MPYPAKHWCFTLNNYSDDDKCKLSSAFDSGRISYLIYGKEVASTGTPHLQGFVSVKKKCRIPGLVKLLGQAHYEVFRDVRASIFYCKKESDYIEFGTSLVDSSNSGKRNDLESFKLFVKGGDVDFKRLREIHSLVMARYL